MGLSIQFMNGFNKKGLYHKSPTSHTIRKLYSIAPAVAPRRKSQRNLNLGQENVIWFNLLDDDLWHSPLSN